MKIETHSVNGYKDINISFSIIRKAKTSSQLAILLPGVSYTTDSPLFHYSTGLFLSHSIDVLEVNYQYKQDVYDEIEEIDEVIKYDVKKVVDFILKNYTYADFFFVGKSLGTIAMSSELKRSEFQNARAIWLTPLLQRDDVLQRMSEHSAKGLCILGGQDYCYSEERYALASKNPQLTSLLLPSINHRMEYNDRVLESIDVLKQVIEEIEGFIEKSD